MPALGLLTGRIFPKNSVTTPEIPLVNMYAESAVTEPTRFALISRLPLTAFGTTYGDGPIWALYQNDGVAGGKIVAVSGSDIYVDGTNVGSLDITAAISIAGNEIGFVITGGGTAKFYNAAAASLRTIAFPDGANVTKVLEQGGRFIFFRAGSGRFYWTEPLTNAVDGSGDLIIGGLAFATAENEPDWLVDGLIYNDSLVLAGSKTIEFWVPTGDDSLPWQPLAGRAFHQGVYKTGYMTLWNNTFAWVSSDGVLWQNGGSAPVMLSNSGVQSAIQEALSLQLDPNDTLLDSFFYFEHEFLRLRSGSTAGNILLDASTGEYCTWNSPGGFARTGFIGGPALSTGLEGLSPGTTTVFGSTNDGNLLVSSYLGAGNTELTAAGPFERVFRFGVPIDGGSVSFDNVVLRCQTGNGEVGGVIPIAPGYGDPTIAMRISRDGGRSWGEWDEIPLGGQSTNRQKVEWRSLGIIDQPGFLAECRTGNSLYFYVSGALFNEPMNGRDRG